MTATNWTVEQYRNALRLANVDPDMVRGCEQTDYGWNICLMPWCAWYMLTPDGKLSAH